PRACPPAAELAGRDWRGGFLARLLGDPYPAVRHIALRSLRQMPGYTDFDLDPVTLAKGLADTQSLLRERMPVAPPHPRDASATAALLLRPDGTPDSEPRDARTNRRDDRPVHLRE